ncbi:MAG TPA: hypothetical protein VKX17_12510 [Planctomycetota bacterium]|nr:hypothetical protein [Planctomycetota bacterium]
MSNSEMRFVVLHHTAWPGHADHYDLMLQAEIGSSDDARVLKTWATAGDEFPGGAPATELLKLPDHRLIYLHYEGWLSNGRGHVSQADAGELVFLKEFEEAAPKKWAFQLRGSRLSGEFSLLPSADAVYLFEKKR